MSDYLKLTFLENASDDAIEKVKHHEFRNKPFSNTEVFLVPIEKFELLTKGQDVRRTYDLKLSTKDILYDFLPGDTIGILPRNHIAEVNEILIRLNIESRAEQIYQLTISKDTTKKILQYQKNIPSNGVLKDIFLYYIDIRKPPKKLWPNFHLILKKQQNYKKFHHTKGTKEYSELINGGARTLLGLLNTFSSCLPPLELILEHSLPSQPRYYSIASSPLEIDSLHVTFFVVEHDDGTKGVCTGWLEEILKKTEGEHMKIPIYFRKPNNFRIPIKFSTPIIMIATGTGLAPFKGFLDHRLLSKISKCDMGEAFLYYGCRYSDRDFLYSKQINDYLKEGVLTSLYTAFSRDRNEKCYVQDRINENGETIVNYILNKDAIVYVCGNTKTMVKDVREAVVNNLVKYGDLDKQHADEYLKELVCQNKFIVDSWS
ncbi:hypothetical protein NQ317_009456 [Molorchus minor]|uniref:NADPH--hemoprotein reductase n=1 Tax=Molorchus minor TaxID=1323400 RepID=A0ABQ9JYI1_9CUCU|nr:hypothetical protein NQ317_009456 [Molorchus minor]